MLMHCGVCVVPTSSDQHLPRRLVSRHTDRRFGAVAGGSFGVCWPMQNGRFCSGRGRAAFGRIRWLVCPFVGSAVRAHRLRVLRRVQPDRARPGRVVVLFRADQAGHRVDQCQVGEGLREVAEVAAAARVDLLGIQQQRAGGVQQPFAQRPRRQYPVRRLQDRSGHWRAGESADRTDPLGRRGADCHPDSS